MAWTVTVNDERSNAGQGVKPVAEWLCVGIIAAAGTTQVGVIRHPTTNEPMNGNIRHIRVVTPSLGGHTLTLALSDNANSIVKWTETAIAESQAVTAPEEFGFYRFAVGGVPYLTATESAAAGAAHTITVLFTMED